MSRQAGRHEEPASPGSDGSPGPRDRWLDEFFRYATAERRLSPNTVDGYSRDLRQFREFLTGYLADENWAWTDVDRLVIRSFLGELDRRGLRRTTIRRKLSAVRSFFSFLHRTDRLTVNPARAVRAPKRARSLPAYLGEDRSRELFEMLERRIAVEGGFLPARERAMLEVFYSCGLRLAEANGLDLKDMDLSRGQVRVTGKGGKQRVVPLGGHATRAIQAYLPLRAATASAEGTAALFLSVRGSRLSRRQMQRAISRTLDAVADGERMSAHALRHTFATHMLDHGADLVAVKELLGHASLSTTRVYTHTSVERLQRVHADAHPRGGASVPERADAEREAEPSRGES